MNNNILQLAGAMRNPKQFVQNMLSNSAAMRNPMMRNAVGMMEKGDYKGMEKMARNICEQRGINPDDAIKQLRLNAGI